MQLRRATLDDAQLLASLNQSIQRMHADARPDVFKPAQLNEALVGWYRELLSQLENHVFIAEIDGEPVGCLYAKIVRRPENPFAYAMDFMLVDQLSVIPEYQGRGYGKRLLQAAFDLARTENLHRVILDVWAFNDHAIEFYKQQGFRVYLERMEIVLE